MNGRRKLKKQNGSITVEAALIFPCIFFCIIVVMFIGIFLYQQTLLQSLANRAVERGATTWDNPYKDIETGRVKLKDISNGGLYWRQVDFYKNDKEENLNKYINERMNNYSILKGIYQVTDVYIENCIAYKKLIVKVEASYENSAWKIFRFVQGSSGEGNDEDFKVKVKTEAIINEPVEFIRNTDFIINLVEDLEEENPGVGSLVGGMREFMNKTKEALTKLFEIGE